MEKKVYVYVGIMVALMLTSIFWINREKDIAKKVVYSDEKLAPMHLTKAKFLSKVANFQTYPTNWKYLGDKPCIIDFYASWCGPCKLVAPIIKDLAKDYDGQIYVYKVDIDAEEEIASAYGIQSIPTIFFCPMNGPPQLINGVISKEAFEKTITGFLLKK